MKLAGLDDDGLVLRHEKPGRGPGRRGSVAKGPLTDSHCPGIRQHACHMRGKGVRVG